MSVAEAAPSEPAAVPQMKLPLRVTRIGVENFRLLKDVDLALDANSTVLVGRNNTGKTSLAEILDRLLADRPFKLEIADFSSESYESFVDAYEYFASGDEKEARLKLPEVTLTMTIDYSAQLAEYGPLIALIVDLDPDCTQAIVKFRYALAGGRLQELFDGVRALHEEGVRCKTADLLALIGKRIPQLFVRTITAIDPVDSSNTRDVTLAAIRDLITVDFLRAQRGLDDEKDRPKDLIGKILETLFAAASKADDKSPHRVTADALVRAVGDIEGELGESVQTMVAGVVPALKQFGYPGMGNLDLATETKLDIEKLLSNYTSVYYAGVAGVPLPESYSGLGSRNLVMILLMLLGFYRDYAIRGNVPGIHLVFIEEPEAHLHPQMQEVFIQQLSALKALFPKIDGATDEWTAQFLISTHASHVANRASFSALRYFRLDATGVDKGNHATVLDLSSAPGIDEKFLHKYLTLTRSDLFFADKVILVEGTTERLIVPKVIEMLNSELDAASLASQYVTLLEVGGAFAHLFFPLLDFLGLPALVITDIDSAGPLSAGKRLAAAVHVGDRTSNATIKNWYGDPEINPLKLLSDAEAGAGRRADRYLAYQVPEVVGGPCGRTFEDAFILANQKIFGLPEGDDAVAMETSALAEAIKYKKSDFAVRFAINEGDWAIPRYLRDGVEWLLLHSAESGSSGASTTSATVIK